MASVKNFVSYLSGLMRLCLHEVSLQKLNQSHIYKFTTNPDAIDVAFLLKYFFFFIYRKQYIFINTYRHFINHISNNNNSLCYKNNNMLDKVLVNLSKIKMR